MKINWENRYLLDEGIRDHMSVAAEKAVLCEGIRSACAIHVCLCNDDAIAEINQKYRGVSASTDVLSFPSLEYPPGYTASQCEHRLRMEYDDDSKACFLGDIFISVPHIRKQASEYGHTELREACYLLIHGICHLMGYDHIDPEDKERMRKMEEKILTSVSVTRDSVDAPSVENTLLSLAREAMKNSYSPYSSYPVGAALHCIDGRIFTGCNIENASFGLTNCAERTALFKAVSEGARGFDIIAIAANTKPWPCGACRQVLNEFAPDIRILVTWDSYVEEKTLRELLPEGFGPDSM
jgi:homotetrameric cytidine deaminase/rRNA maturation RNase YbeY